MRYFVELKTENNLNTNYVYVYANNAEEVRNMFKDYTVVCVDQTE